MNKAKVIGLPGDTSIGPGGTRTLSMDAPCDFIGRRLCIQAIDTATGSDELVIVQSVTHDNKEMIGHGRTSLVPSIAFCPPVWRFLTAAGPVSAAGVNPGTEFHEEFCVGDLFTVTIFNQTGQNIQMLIYWVTDYGESCGCKKRR